MMMSPEGYAERYKGAEYHEMIKERDRLIDSIRQFEQKQREGDRSGEEWMIEPSPEVVYQCNLEYLAELCKMIQEKYNRVYVWGTENEE